MRESTGWLIPFTATSILAGVTLAPLDIGSTAWIHIIITMALAFLGGACFTAWAIARRVENVKDKLLKGGIPMEDIFDD